MWLCPRFLGRRRQGAQRPAPCPASHKAGSRGSPGSALDSTAPALPARGLLASPPRPSVRAGEPARRVLVLEMRKGCSQHFVGGFQKRPQARRPGIMHFNVRPSCSTAGSQSGRHLQKSNFKDPSLRPGRPAVLVPQGSSQRWREGRAGGSSWQRALLPADPVPWESRGHSLPLRPLGAGAPLPERKVTRAPTEAQPGWWAPRPAPCLSQAVLFPTGAVSL